ncbi:MAG: hypothetical protein JWM80_5015 [Cyanobacteria bacterium RYN_339]|nr:hypothetical protein [Cyanobacteria bacterium RYN_339]
MNAITSPQVRSLPAAATAGAVGSSAAYRNHVILLIGYGQSQQQALAQARRLGDAVAERQASQELAATAVALRQLATSSDAATRSRWLKQEGFDFNAFWASQQAAMLQVAPTVAAMVPTAGRDGRPTTALDVANAVFNTIGDPHGRNSADGLAAALAVAAPGKLAAIDKALTAYQHAWADREQAEQRRSLWTLLLPWVGSVLVGFTGASVLLAFNLGAPELLYGVGFVGSAVVGGVLALVVEQSTRGSVERGVDRKREALLRAVREVL